MPSARRDQLVRQRATQQFGEEAAARAAEHDLRDVLELGEAQQLGGDVAGRERACLGAERAAQASRPRRHGGDAASLSCSPGPSTVTAIHGASITSARRLAARTIEGVAVGADAGQDAFARRPRPLDRLRLHVLDQVGIDALGGAAQGQLAQRRQVLRLEEALRARSAVSGT